MNQQSPADMYLDNVDPIELLMEIDRLDYEESFYKFFQGGWRYIDPAPMVIGPPIEAVAEHLQAVVEGDIKRLIINIPPRMSKSSLCSVSLPAYVWAQRIETPTSGPGVQFLHASYSQQLSLRDSVKCRRLIDSPWYQKYWGDRFRLTSDQNTKTRFDNSRAGSRLCTSVGSTLTGEGGNIIVVDDPNAAQEAFSEATIATTIEWWDTALSTRLNDPRTGAFIVIQQRLAEDDLTGHILSKDEGEWTHLMLPMRYEPERSFHTAIGWKDWRTEPGELLWPDRFGEPEVRALESTLGPYGAAGQLQQRPEVKGGGILKREWWQDWDADNYPPFDYILASLDTAYTEKQENDPSALTIWGVFSQDIVAQANRTLAVDGNTYQINRTYNAPTPRAMLIYAWTERLEFNDLVTRVRADCKRFRVDKLLIESKAAGISTAQEVRRLKGSDDYDVQLLDPGSQDKVARLYAVQPIFAQEVIYTPDRLWADQVISQCAAFPKAKHDDLVDTVSQAINFLRRNGMLRVPEEIQDDMERDMLHRGAPPQPLYPS